MSPSVFIATRFRRIMCDNNAMFRVDFEKSTSCSLEVVIWHLRAFEYQRTGSLASCLLCILLTAFTAHLFTLFLSPTLLLRHELNNAGESRHSYLSILNGFKTSIALIHLEDTA
jgi:hypothetical protein